jgi:hypothetical protein
LAKIANDAQRARLAEAGDHIDFVVTLLAGKAETVGRLERQTSGGTVAIRELRDATCAQVASALALSLGLALDPPGMGSEAGDPTPVAESQAALTPAQAVEAAPAPVAAPVAPAVSIVATPLAPSPPRADAAASHPHHRPTFGVDAGALTGLGTQTMLRGSAFLDFARVTQQLSLRLALVGALGSSPTPFGSVSRWLLAQRSEVCPWRWGGARLGLSPCSAFELGLTSASLNGSSDHSLWAAPALGLRATLALAPAFRIEIGASVLLPLVRGHVFHGTQLLYQDEIIAFQGVLGVSFGQP